MSFTVRARVSARQFSFHQGSMLGALDQSLTLITAGMSDVRIVDAEGTVHSPASLHQLLFGQRAAEKVVAPAATAIDQLAA